MGQQHARPLHHHVLLGQDLPGYRVLAPISSPSFRSRGYLPFLPGCPDHLQSWYSAADLPVAQHLPGSHLVFGRSPAVRGHDVFSTSRASRPFEAAGAGSVECKSARRLVLHVLSLIVTGHAQPFVHGRSSRVPVWYQRSPQKARSDVSRSECGHPVAPCLCPLVQASILRPHSN